MVITQLFWGETAFIYSYLLSAPTASQGPVFQLPIFQWKSQKHVELIPTPRNKFISHTDNLRNIFYRQSQKHVDLFNDNLAAMLPLSPIHVFSFAGEKMHISAMLVRSWNLQGWHGTLRQDTQYYCKYVLIFLLYHVSDIFIGGWTCF